MNKQILRLAIPNIISNLSVPLLGAVDTALVGHLEATFYIGAVAVGTMIFNVVYWGFGFLRMGTTGLTAQAYGREDRSDQILTLARAVLVALGGGLLLVTLQRPIAQLAFWLVDGTPDVETYARSYFLIRIWAAPATLCIYAFQGWFLGMQNARYPMYLVVFVNLANVCFDLLFIKVFAMKSDGAALGTVVAAWMGLGLALVLFSRTYRPLLVHLERRLILQFAALERFFAVNRDITIRTLALVFSYSFFTAKSAELGETTVAVNSILMQFWMIMAYAVDGFAFAAEGLVGRYVGAGDSANLRRAVKLSFLWGTGFGVLFALVYLALDRQLLSIFTDKPDLIEIALQFYPWILIGTIINVFCYIWDGVYIGATATKPMVFSMILSTGVGFLLTYYLTIGSLGNHALWLAMTLFMALRGITLTLYAPRAIFAPLKSAIQD
ncbi:MAG: MATE family efflux transporter [bacterium]